MYMKALFTISMAIIFVGCSVTDKKTAGKDTESVQIVDNSQKEQITTDQLKKELSSIVDRAMESDGQSRKHLATNLFLKANEMSKTGDYKSSTLLFKYASELQPEDPYIKIKYSIDLIRMGDIKLALDTLGPMFGKTERFDDKIGMILGGLYTTFGQMKKAKKVYQKLVDLNPQNTDACVFLAKSYSNEEKYKEAFGLLKKCQKDNPDDPIFPYYEGKIYLQLAKNGQALKKFKEALSMNQSYYQAALGIGLIHEESGRDDEALKVYEDFLLVWPTNRIILNRLVNLLYSLERFKKLTSYAETLTQIDPTDYNMKLKLGIIYTELENYKRAIEIYKDILEDIPNSDKIQFYLGAVYQATKEYDLSNKYFKMIGSESSLFAEAAVNVAQNLNLVALKDQNSDTKDAFVDYIKETADSHKFLEVELKIILANFYESQENLNTAISTLEPYYIQNRFHENHEYYLASLYEKTKQYKKSTAIVNKMIESDPNNAHAWNFLGYSLLERGVDLDRAYEYIKKAVKISPRDGYIRDSLGWYYYKVGKYKKALSELKKAYEYVDNDVVIAKHLALTYQKMHNFEQAKFFFVEALKNSRLDSEREDVIKAMEKMESKRTPASVANDEHLSN